MATGAPLDISEWGVGGKSVGLRSSDGGLIRELWSSVRAMLQQEHQTGISTDPSDQVQINPTVSDKVRVRVRDQVREEGSH